MLHERDLSRRDDYGDLPALFVELARHGVDTAEYLRLRARIVQRCLPLADHIAYRYSQRGERHEDLVQVARVGLMNAVNRFNVDAGSDFLAFAVPTIMGEVPGISVTVAGRCTSRGP